MSQLSKFFAELENLQDLETLGQAFQLDGGDENDMDWFFNQLAQPKFVFDPERHSIAYFIDTVKELGSNVNIVVNQCEKMSSEDINFVKDHIIDNDELEFKNIWFVVYDEEELSERHQDDLLGFLPSYDLETLRMNSESLVEA